MPPLLGIEDKALDKAVWARPIEGQLWGGGFKGGRVHL